MCAISSFFCENPLLSSLLASRYPSLCPLLLELCLEDRDNGHRRDIAFPTQFVYVFILRPPGTTCDRQSGMGAHEENTIRNATSYIVK